MFFKKLIMISIRMTQYMMLEEILTFLGQTLSHRISKFNFYITRLVKIILKDRLFLMQYIHSLTTKRRCLVSGKWFLVDIVLSWTYLSRISL